MNRTAFTQSPGSRVPESPYGASGMTTGLERSATNCIYGIAYATVALAQARWRVSDQTNTSTVAIRRPSFSRVPSA